MTQLIAIKEQKGIQLVDARELHKKLRTGRDYSNWIKGRIQEYGFVKNEDYFTDNHRSPDLASKEIRKGGFNKIDYHITTDMAKELAMVERNEMGRKIRRYFIEVEKQARANTIALPPPRTYNGIKCIHYTSWLIQNNYSLTSSRVGARIRKYPEQFRKSGYGQWYMSEAIADYFLAFRDPQKRATELPSINPKQLKLF